MSPHSNPPCSKRLRMALVVLIGLGGCSDPDRPTMGLYPAIERGDLDQIERHIHWGTQINAPSIDGQTPLHAAAHMGQIVVVRLLIDNGAPIDAPDREGRTPLYQAVMAGRTQAAELLVQRGARIDPTALLHAALERGVADRDVVAFLVKQGADIEGRDAAGDTPLLAATRRGERIFAKLLIARGANVNARDSQGRTPLAIALQQGHNELQRLLRDNGGRAD